MGSADLAVAVDAYPAAARAPGRPPRTVPVPSAQVPRHGDGNSRVRSSGASQAAGTKPEAASEWSAICP